MAKPSRSCDRCYSIKERCQWKNNSPSCDRCTRLQHVCENRRATKQRGRKPRWPGFIAASSTSILSAQLPGLSGTELRAIKDLITSDEFLLLFSTSQEFVDSQRQVVLSLLLSDSCPAVKDAIVAAAMAWVPRLKDDDQQDGFRRASYALGTLSALDVLDENDMLSCLVLGSFIHLFIFKARVDDVSIICRKVLNLIKPVYEKRELVDPTNCFMLAAVLMADISECLLRGQAPIVRYRLPADSSYIDGYCGLWSGLLPFFHDICQLNHALLQPTDAERPDLLCTLDETERNINSWQPTVPSSFHTRFSSSEVAHMLCQAQVMRWAALLIIHRLRFPYGCANREARVLSAAIISQLRITSRVTNEPTKAVNMAVIAAYLEMEGPEQMEALKELRALVKCTDKFQSRVENMIISLWKAKEQGLSLYWYNIGDVLYPEQTSVTTYWDGASAWLTAATTTT